MPDISSLYSDKVMDHFRNPRNLGEIKNPDAVATVGNKTCGDIMRIFLKVKKRKDEEYISEIKFQTLGCGAAIATSSMATELVKGKTLKEAEKITNRAVANALGGLPPAKRHCSVLAEEAILKAIRAYKNKKSS